MSTQETSVSPQKAATSAGNAPKPTRSLWVLAGAPVALLGLLFLAQLVIEARFVYFPEATRLVNSLFLPVGAVPLAVLAAVGVVKTGRLQLAWLGAGGIALGLAIVLANFVGRTYGGDSGIKIQNLGVLVAGAFHFTGALITLSSASLIPSARQRRVRVLITCYSAAVAAVLVISALTVLGWLPQFFVPGEGGTPLRQAVLTIATGMFAGSALLALVTSSRTRSPFLYVYGLGLTLVGLGQLAYSFTITSGDPMSWLGRVGQWSGAVYFLLATAIVTAQSRSGVGGFQEVVESLFPSSAEGYKLLVRSSADAIIGVGPDGKVVVWNAAAEKMLGYTSDEAVGKALEEVTLIRLQDIAADNDQTGRSEVLLHSRNGRRFWAGVSQARGDAGGLSMAAIVVRDISARKEAEARLNAHALALEAANEELEAFAYSVSHDLRAPLRSMEGFSSALLEDYCDKLDETGKEYLTYIKQSSDLMGRLIDDMLKLSRVTRQEMRRETVDLSALAGSVFAELRKSQPSREVEVNVSPGLVAQGDRGLLRLAVQNLLGNAWKFSGNASPARIEIGAAHLNGRKAYFVRDNGVGFDMAYAGKLFQPFQRLHKSSAFAGTGIGLATVQRVVRRHGGEVWAESKPGQGATFYFTLGETP